MSVMQKDVALMDDKVPMEWDPFTDPQEGAPFFSGAGRADTVEQLQHLLRYGPGLVVLAGGNGVGKQTLVDYLLDQLDVDLFDVADLQANVMLSFQQLLTSLEEPWRSLHPITLENYLELVPALASAADEESKTLLCLVRDAEQLDGESIADLKALLGVASGLPLKFLLVVGATEIEQAPHIRGLVEALPESHTLYLDPLTPEQTADYLRFRLQAAGLGKASFTTSQLEQIMRASGGIPARINSAARELLLEAMPVQTAQARNPGATGFKFTKLHFGALAALLIIVALFALWGGEEEVKNAPEVATADLASNRIVLENAAQPVAETAPTEDRFAEVGRVAVQSSDVEPPTLSNEMAAESTAEPFEAEPPLESAPASSLSATSVAPSASTQPAVPQALSQPSAQPVPTVVVPSPAIEQPAPVQKSVAVASPSAKPADKPAPVSTSAVDSRTRWLQGLPASHYVIQLLGASEETTVKRFLAQYPSLKQVTHYQTLRQGKPWFVVVQGDYVDYEAAKAGVKRLPAAIQQQTPWVRQASAVQKELKTR